MLAIIVEEKSKTFHLQMDNSSYIFQVMENGELEQLYYRKKVHARSQYPNLIIREQKTATVAWRQDRPDIQPDVLKQEYSSFGKGDFRYPAYQLIMKDGSRISEFVYNSYEKFNGKKRLPDLPSTFDDVSDDSETLFTAISKIIEETKLDYVKWDMNRHITEMFSIELSAETQLEMPHRYILGVYRLYERLTKAYPKILFESCSSGGGRFDLGMMYYAPQAWTSYGDELMNAGLFIHQLTKLRKDIKVSNDFQAILFVLEAVN